MNNETKASLEELIRISRHYGRDKQYVIAGGGNTSFKTDERIWIKASGHPLANISIEGMAELDRKKLEVISSKSYSSDPLRRENEIKSDLNAACISEGKRPSVETSLHNLIDYRFVVHLHPTLVNGLLCTNDAEATLKDIFGKELIYIPYADPGYVLFKRIEKDLSEFRKREGKDPRVIMIQNHGVFVGANETSEIRHIYEDMFVKLNSRIKMEIPTGELDIPDSITGILPALRMILSTEKLKTLRIRNNKLISHFTSSRQTAEKISRPFTPDIIVYCKSHYIYCDAEGPAGEIVTELAKKINDFTLKHAYTPRVILVKGIGLIAVAENAAGADTILDVFEDLMKISWLSESFGAQHFMSDEQIGFIDSWEVENYRRKMTAGDISSSPPAERVIIVTGGAKGFGEGIVRGLYRRGGNIVIADIDSPAGEDLAAGLNAEDGKNQVKFFRTDVSDTQSLQDLMKETLRWFGGLDTFISNAGILHAGGLEEMDEETFDRVTRINYNAYFYGTKYASRIMKLQYETLTRHAQDTDSSDGAAYFCDIIQINSKSGLSGSKKNFAYAGGKFGGIGLTQSFALELAPHRIKVNSVCPGNFFEGPLWSDPENGLFVQYLNTGKVQGAKTIDEVRAHYEKQVPLGRGCRVEDVLKAILYVMEQEYETGQAIPVTGGQIMLS